jgi:2,5-diketo-D-gluconate reductase A
MAAADSPTVTLAGDIPMPLVGLGTWQMRGHTAYDAVRYALTVGYRHLDTATAYRNEAEIGRAVRDSGIPRAHVFITTKLPPEHAGRERRTMEASLAALGTDYVDLWLVHWPPGDRAGVDVWRQLLDIREAGSARAVGVSNYSPGQLDELIEATGVAPAVNQIRWSPQLYDTRRLEHSRSRGVVLEGYSPFRAGRLDVPTLQDIASAHGVEPAQVVLRWHIQHDIPVIPKSARAERIASNFDVFRFSLDSAEMARIDALSRVR